jgi:hypothetical protein
MLMNLTIRGAYGRRYNTEEAVLGDWENGFDFFIWEFGQYCSIRDFSGNKGHLDTPIFRLDTGASIEYITLPRGK